MAESTSVPPQSSVSDEDLRRAEEFTLEPFVHEGESRADVLAAGNGPPSARSTTPWPRSRLDAMSPRSNGGASTP